MTRIIKDGAVQESPFVMVLDATVDTTSPNLILPLELYLASRGTQGINRDAGVWLDSDEAVESLIEGDPDGWSNSPVIALNFPAFNDGRALSSANILRRKYGFSGEIRAVGDVRRDQLEQMMRCGFNAFQMAEGHDPEAAIAGLKSFSENYQITADRQEPLFRRR